MRSRIWTCITTIILLSALAIAMGLAAQEQQGPPEQKAGHPGYKLIDLGTFGGPTSISSGASGTGNGFSAGFLSRRGTVVGVADTSVGDPYSPNCSLDCFVAHAFQ
jgi:hypothetical protein